ncbi:hypothetical protein IAU59_007584 [Kwoniella sp. CBS 9459]
MSNDPTKGQQPPRAKPPRTKPTFDTFTKSMRLAEHVDDDVATEIATAIVEDEKLEAAYVKTLALYADIERKVEAIKIKRHEAALAESQKRELEVQRELEKTTKASPVAQKLCEGKPTSESPN